MVLSLKTWKSRSLPGLPRTEFSSSRSASLRRKKARGAIRIQKSRHGSNHGGFFVLLRAVPRDARHSLPFTFVHENESDKAGKHDSIRCDRVNRMTDDGCLMTEERTID